jgi:hypothetical protein
MSKNIYQNLFNLVIVVVFVAAVLTISNVAWAQTVSPRIGYIPVGVGWHSDGNLVTHHPEVEFQKYVPNETTPWNGLNTVKGAVPIENLVLPAFPVPASKIDLGTIDPNTWPTSPIEITVDLVNDYWDEIYKESEGWSKLYPPSTSYNCHGHSTRPPGQTVGVSRFINGKLLGDNGVLKIDYDERSKAKDIDIFAVYGDDGHTIRIDHVIREQADGIGQVHAICATSEKFDTSVVYKRTLELKDRLYYHDNAEIPNPETPRLSPMNPFWIRKP